jgi:hypothetical protein
MQNLVKFVLTFDPSEAVITSIHTMLIVFWIQIKLFMICFTLVIVYMCTSMFNRFLLFCTNFVESARINPKHSCFFVNASVRLVILMLLRNPWRATFLNLVSITTDGIILKMVFCKILTKILPIIPTQQLSPKYYLWNYTWRVQVALPLCFFHKSYAHLH